MKRNARGWVALAVAALALLAAVTSAPADRRAPLGGLCAVARPYDAGDGRFGGHVGQRVSATYDIDTSGAGDRIDAYAGWTFDQTGPEAVYRIKLNHASDISISDDLRSHGLDVHVLWANCNTDRGHALANGASEAAVDDAPRGTYLLVVDGRNGYAGATTITITAVGRS